MTPFWRDTLKAMCSALRQDMERLGIFKPKPRPLTAEEKHILKLAERRAAIGKKWKEDRHDDC